VAAGKGVATGVAGEEGKEDEDGDDGAGVWERMSGGETEGMRKKEFPGL